MAAYLRLNLQCEKCKRDVNAKAWMPKGSFNVNPPRWEPDGSVSLKGWLLPTGEDDGVDCDQIRCGDCREAK